MKIVLQGGLASAIHQLQPIFAAITQAGGRPLVVGGAVRDYLLGLDPKDVDVEVYGLSADHLIGVLQPFGKVNIVGRSFGVIKLRQADGTEIDFALPRRESKIGAGHRGFLVEPDPTMTPREAAARRDFTCNAIALTPDGELLDYFNGAADLHQRLLRHTSPAFVEDPLRVLRAMQFAARFDLHLAPETVDLCRALLPEAATLSRERIWGEWQKWALKSTRPSAGLRVLEQTGWLALTPELAAMHGSPHNERYHPEGDVWVHTQHVCDAAAQIATREQLADEPRTVLLFAALTHDLGKPPTTCRDAAGFARNPGHARAGVPLATSLFERIAAPRRVIERVEPLVCEHMAHLRLQPVEADVRHLSVRLKPASVTLWAHLLEADYSGRPPYPPGQPGAAYLALAQQLGVAEAPPSPILTGHHLLDAGLQPGPHLGDLLRAAYTAQLDGSFSTVEQALDWVVQRGKAG